MATTGPAFASMSAGRGGRPARSRSGFNPRRTQNRNPTIRPADQNRRQVDRRHLDRQRPKLRQKAVPFGLQARQGPDLAGRNQEARGRDEARNHRM